MGILSKFFSKQEIEVIKDLENHMDSTIKRTQSDFLALVGVSGKIKGLEIITLQGVKIDLDSKQIRRYNAKLAEYYIRYNTIQLISDDDLEKLQYITYNFGEKTQITIFPIEGSQSMTLTAQSNHPKRILKDISKYNEIILQLQTNKD